MDGRCETCRFWRGGYCDKIEEGDGTPMRPGTAAEIDVEVADDHGLVARLRTLPTFGCTLHEVKR